MTDEHFDQAFERMRTELNVTPSPEFVVKVRQQNERTSARSSWSVWAWTGAAATCAAAVIAVAVWRGPTPEPQTQTVENRPRESFSPNRKPQESFSPVQAPTPQVAPHRTLRTSRAPKTVVVATTPKPELDVLVPPDQLNAIRRLMSSVRAGASAPAAPTPNLIDPDTGKLITPTPIEISLITVTPLPGAREGRSGGRDNR